MNEFRYVDQNLIISKGTNKPVWVMVNNYNTVNKNIKFTVDAEIDNKINFLGLTTNISYNKI